jgi:nitrite reductase/ring-hydroxylating ferredoxin subunit
MVALQQWTRVASYSELKATNCLTVNVEGHTLVLFAYGNNVYAVDNRCPHMGFPLNKGSVNDGILTCYWHYARFDLASGGTFDLFADDVPAFPARIEGDDVLVDVTPRQDQTEQHRKRVTVGLEQNLVLVLAKSVIGLHRGNVSMAEPFRTGLQFGTEYRGSGWGQGLTILGCMINLVNYLEDEQKPRAMYLGLSAVANDTSMHSPHFSVGALPNPDVELTTLKKWFRSFIEVRDNEGAERVILSAIRAGADDKQMADMLFAAATDHRYVQVGHVLDFINKAFESLDVAGWDEAEPALSSLASILAGATRMEESNSWRSPIDLIEILQTAFEDLPSALKSGAGKNVAPDFDALVAVLLDDKPQVTVDTLLDTLRSGVSPQALAGVVAYAAAIRIAQFHTSNEFGDWDTALHTFTFANAVHNGLRRVNSTELVRGIFDAAMSIYLDRFLNIPAQRLPQPTQKVENADSLLDDLEALLNRQQMVNEAANIVANYLHSGGDANKLMARMGRLLLREDRDFHTIQCIEASFRQYSLLKGTPYANHVLIAGARYLAAHAPTMRAQGQTYQIAWRLARGEKLFEG